MHAYSLPAPRHTRLQVGAAAIEIWTMDDGYFFDNIVISNSVEEAEKVGNSNLCIWTRFGLGGFGFWLAR